jgi:hypothetical protein
VARPAVAVANSNMTALSRTEEQDLRSDNGVAANISQRISLPLSQSGANSIALGKEYSQMRTGVSADLAEIAVGSSAATLVLKTGRSIFQYFLDWAAAQVAHEEENALTREELMAAIEAKKRERASRPNGAE